MEDVKFCKFIIYFWQFLYIKRLYIYEDTKTTRLKEANGIFIIITSKNEPTA